MSEQVISALATSGPVAIILGFIAWRLYLDNKGLRAEANQLRDRHEDRINDLQGQMLKLALRTQKAVEILAGIKTEGEHD